MTTGRELLLKHAQRMERSLAGLVGALEHVDETGERTPATTILAYVQAVKCEYQGFNMAMACTCTQTALDSKP